MHLEVLGLNRKKLLDRLAFVTEHKFYLAGGTALALQIGHRASADFGFYTATPFDPVTFWARFHREIPASENTRIADGTLLAMADKNIEFSFFLKSFPRRWKNTTATMSIRSFRRSAVSRMLTGNPIVLSKCSKTHGGQKSKTSF